MFQQLFLYIENINHRVTSLKKRPVEKENQFPRTLRDLHHEIVELRAKLRVVTTSVSQQAVESAREHNSTLKATKRSVTEFMDRNHLSLRKTTN